MAEHKRASLDFFVKFPAEIHEAQGKIYKAVTSSDPWNPTLIMVRTLEEEGFRVGYADSADDSSVTVHLNKEAELIARVFRHEPLFRALQNAFDLQDPEVENLTFDERVKAQIQAWYFRRIAEYNEKKSETAENKMHSEHRLIVSQGCLDKERELLAGNGCMTFDDLRAYVKTVFTLVGVTGRR